MDINTSPPPPPPQVVESLAKAGAGIQEVNTLRKAISQTKGGRLAEAAAPAKVRETLAVSEGELC